MSQEQQSIIDQVNKINERNIVIMREMESREKDALANEQKARDLRMERQALKEELAANTNALNSLRVKQHILSESERATKAREQAEKAAAENVVKGQEVDRLRQELEAKLAALEPQPPAE